MSIDPRAYRQTLGLFVTGVTVIAMEVDGSIRALTANSFTSLSLNPPLVLFCADHRGRSWPRMRDAGLFTVNVLHHEQHDIVERFGSPSGGRFDGLDWYPSADGGPSLAEALMRIHCSVDQVHVAGDHDVVIGRVLSVDDTGAGRPMLFYRGTFTVTEKIAEAAGPDAEAADDYWG